MIDIIRRLFSEQLRVELLIPFLLMVVLKSSVTMAGIPYVQGRLIDAFNKMDLSVVKSMSLFKFFLCIYCGLYCLGSLSYMAYKYIELMLLTEFELKLRKDTIQKHIVKNRSYDWKKKLDGCLNEIKIIPNHLSYTLKDLFNNLFPSAIASIVGIVFWCISTRYSAH